MPSPASPPLAATRRMPEHTVPAAGRGHRDAGQQCDLGSRCLGTEQGGRRHFCPCPASPAPGIPLVLGAACRGQGEKQAGVQAAGWKQLAASQCHPTRGQTSNPVLGGRRGARSTEQPRQEEEAVAPSRSPMRQCYIYPPAGPGLGLSPVTQTLQPARIRGDGTFLSKNNPPLAGERAGVEVTDWTAAPTALLTGERPSRCAVPQDGELARVATTPAPCPGGWGRAGSPQAGPSATPSASSVVCGHARGPVASRPVHPPALQASRGTGPAPSSLHCPAPGTCPHASWDRHPAVALAKQLCRGSPCADPTAAHGILSSSEMLLCPRAEGTGREDGTWESGTARGN